jgi:NAD(P)-dependent dehydrogenase (short-subunit alcohol dehydrogenase family)/GNAT superfamily N-acetyltransferase
MKIIKAGIAHLHLISSLFNAYRVFYDQPSDISKAFTFIEERLKNNDSIIFLATDYNEAEGYGFVQLYPSFTSIGVDRTLILNDLYVKPEHRKKGIARQLLHITKQHAVKNSVHKILLETSISNEIGQKLYESEGYKRINGWATYFLEPPKLEVENEPSVLTSIDSIQNFKSKKNRNDDKKLVVITGITKGLGRAMVDRFAEAGWFIAGCARSNTETVSLHSNEVCDFQNVDVSDPIAVKIWGEKLIDLYGAPSLLINNASIVNKSAYSWDVPQEEFAHVMNININGVMNVIQAFVPAMIQKKTGIIINISSGWGRSGEAMVAPYCASKFAVEGLTQSLAKELPKGMAAVALDPGGSIDTAMLRACVPDEVSNSPSPEIWSRVAVPYILTIKPEDNGKSLTCPRPVPNK